MQLTIEVIKLGDEYVALAVEKGKLWSSGACGGGMTERAAIQAATNAFFTHRENAEFRQQAGLNLTNDLLAPAVEGPVLRPQGVGYQSDAAIEARASQAPRTASGRRAVRALLEDAISGSFAVFISGTRVDGSRYENREVRPFKITEKYAGIGYDAEYLYVDDIDSGETRTFKLVGIDRVEEVKA